MRRCPGNSISPRLAYQTKPFHMWRREQGKEIMDWLVISHRRKKKERKKASREKNTHNTMLIEEETGLKQWTWMESHSSCLSVCSFVYCHGIYLGDFVLFAAHREFWLRMPMCNCVNTHLSPNHKSIRYLTPLLFSLLLRCVFLLSFMSIRASLSLKYRKKSCYFNLKEKKMRGKKRKSNANTNVSLLNIGWWWPKIKGRFCLDFIWIDACVNAKHYWRLIIVVFF